MVPERMRGDVDDDAPHPRPGGRGAPLIATWTRWALTSATLGAAFVAVAAAYVALAHAGRTLVSFSGPIVLASALEALLLLALLRAEESRVARELRTARTGTAALRGMAIRRRQQLPFFARLFSTKLGTAAVLLADGDRDGALDALAGGSALMRGGGLDALRALVEADLERAGGTSVGLERCVQRLRAMPPTGNREADLYRLHVLVKALLEQGDPEGALDLVADRAATGDDEERLYLVWLRVWFDLDAPPDEQEAGEEPPQAWPALAEGELRVAALLARAHGADKLVEKLESRVSAIARPGHRE